MGFHHRRLINTMQPETVLLLRYLRQIGGGVSASRASIIDDFIGSLKQAGIWTKLDALNVFAQENATAALVNWKRPGTYDVTLFNSPTFTADRGFAGNNSNMYIDTNFNPTTAISPQYTLDSASRFARVLSVPSNDIIWGDTANFHNAFSLGSGAGQVYLRMNCTNASGEMTSTDASPAGFLCGNRSGSSAQQIYKNGASVTSNTVGSSALQNVNFSILRCQTNYGVAQIGLHGFGSSLTANEHVALASAEAIYMRAIGAI